jgi:aminodeoxyfutalosine synthase
MINLIKNINIPPALKAVCAKVFEGQRISAVDGLLLYSKAELSLLGVLANFVREKTNGKKTYFIKNIHIEPTNICIYNCRFCSYSKKENEGGWLLSKEEIFGKIKSYKNSGIAEIHIVGGVHPDFGVFHYAELLKGIKNIIPSIHIKAFTAIELDYMIKKEGLSYSEGLKILKESGLDSIPGGGAEIFDEEVRSKICSKKSSSSLWLSIHETAHALGIPSNATMLYGHIENYSHRIDHLNRLRSLQDKTGKFNAFIPLKFRNKNNEFSDIKETTVIEDMKNYAVSRIFLDNIPHIKSYWPMIGKDITQLSLSFGVDDIDGTIDDTTKIYSMAGATDVNPSMNSDEMVALIKQVGFEAVERNSLYGVIKEY